MGSITPGALCFGPDTQLGIPMSLLKIDYSKRVFGLDVFRAIAICIVVLTHGIFLAGDIFSFLPSVPLIDGVELFFVLSGFLIGSMLMKQTNDAQFGFGELKVFLKRRWFRTLPNYYLVLLLNVLLVNRGVIGGDINYFNWRFLIFAHNFSEGFMAFFLESWSLSVEEWFYIFLPLLLLLYIRFLKPKTAFLCTILTLILFPLAYRFSISGKTIDHFWWDTNFRKVVLTRLDAIGFGVLMAYVKFYFPAVFTKYRVWSFLLGLAVILILLYTPKDPNDLFTKTLYFTCISIGAALLLPFADSVKRFRFRKWGVLVTYISILSYSMYLLNLLIASLFAHYLMPTRRLENALYFGLYWLLVLAISYLMYRFFEKPVTDLRDKKLR
jgi:peptidoglycan/LPS O-acetylase OafA/YrhL